MKISPMFKVLKVTHVSKPNKFKTKCTLDSTETPLPYFNNSPSSFMDI